MKAYTDYPHGTLREVEVVSYDHNKYCILADGSDVKSGYLYRNRRKVNFKYETLVRNFPINYTEK